MLLYLIGRPVLNTFITTQEERDELIQAVLFANIPQYVYDQLHISSIVVRMQEYELTDLANTFKVYARSVKEGSPSCLFFGVLYALVIAAYKSPKAGFYTFFRDEIRSHLDLKWLPEIIKTCEERHICP
jgi:hypothetical protein